MGNTSNRLMVTKPASDPEQLRSRDRLEYTEWHWPSIVETKSSFSCYRWCSLAYVSSGHLARNR